MSSRSGPPTNSLEMHSTVPGTQQQSVYPSLDMATSAKNAPSQGAMASAPSYHTIETEPNNPLFSNDPKNLGGRAIMPTSQIEMTISCRHLLNKDYLSKSDPYCLVLIKDSWKETFVELGRTETIQDTLSPEWIKKFIIDYNFEIVQKMRFEIWDQDPEGRDFLGCHETTLAEIVSFASRQYIRPLEGMPGKKNCGEIIIVTEEMSTCKQIVQMQFAAESLPRFFCKLVKPDAFLVLSRSNEDGKSAKYSKSLFHLISQFSRYFFGGNTK